MDFLKKDTFGKITRVRSSYEQDDIFQAPSTSGIFTMNEKSVPFVHEFHPFLRDFPQKRKIRNKTKTGFLRGFGAAALLFVILIILVTLYFCFHKVNKNDLGEVKRKFDKFLVNVNPFAENQKDEKVQKTKKTTSQLYFTTPSTSSTSTLPVASKQCKNRVVGYFKASGQQVVTDYQLTKLTHVIFKNLKTDKNGTLGFSNNLEEMKFVDLREKVKRAKGKLGVKLMVSISDGHGEMSFSKMAKSKESRSLFIASILKFLTHHNLDGVDIDWRHPLPSDLENQSTFIQQLHQSLSPKNLILSMTASGTEWKFENQMKLEEIIEYVEFLNVFSFDYYKSSSKFTGPPAPLFSGIGEFRGLNVDRTLQFFVCKTRKPSKINMGIPFFAQYWENATLKQKIEENDEMWRISKSPSGKGYLPWNKLTKNGWNISNSSWHKNAMVPFIWDSKNSRFLGFENPKSIAKKLNYTLKKNIGGVMIESLNDDDDENTLLNSASSCITSQSDDVNYKCLIS